MLDHGNARALDGMVRVLLEDRNYEDAETQVGGGGRVGGGGGGEVKTALADPHHSASLPLDCLPPPPTCTRRLNC